MNFHSKFGVKMKQNELLKLENVWAYYDNTPVLENINLSIMASDFVGIIGPNGGGKTTLLKIILGLIKPGQGQIIYSNLIKNRNNIGYVSQANLFDREFPASVWDIVITGRFRKAGLIKHYSQTDKLAVTRALEAVKMLDDKDKQIGKLSGGEQQRVFIARALVSDPVLLLLDEPTASVDTTTQTEFYELLEQLKTKMAIILVSHDISAVSIYVDKIACLNRQLVYHGSAELSPEILEATYKCPVQMIAHGDVPHRVLKEH